MYCIHCNLHYYRAHPDTDSAVSLTLSLLHSGQTLVRRQSPGGADARFYSNSITVYTPSLALQLLTNRMEIEMENEWNSLPAPLRGTNSIYSFRKQLLKMNLF